MSDLPLLHKLEPFLSKTFKTFQQELFFSFREFYFPTLVLDMIKIYILDLIFQNTNIRWRGWIIIWIVRYFWHRLITFIIIFFNNIKGENIMYSLLIKILTNFNIFHITEKSWFPITIATFIKTVFYFCKLWRFLCWGWRRIYTIGGNFYFDGTWGFLAVFVGFDAVSLIISASGASGYLNGVSLKRHSFTHFSASDDV